MRMGVSRYPHQTPPHTILGASKTPALLQMPLPSVTFPDIQSLSGIRACPLQQAWRRYQMAKLGTDTATNREEPYPGCVQRAEWKSVHPGVRDHKCTRALSFFQSSMRKLLGDLG